MMTDKSSRGFGQQQTKRLLIITLKITVGLPRITAQVTKRIKRDVWVQVWLPGWFFFFCSTRLHYGLNATFIDRKSVEEVYRLQTDRYHLKKQW